MNCYCMVNLLSVNYDLLRKLKGKGPLGRTRSRWKCNIKMDLQEVGCWSMDWIELAQEWDRWREIVNVVINLRVT